MGNIRVTAIAMLLFTLVCAPVNAAEDDIKGNAISLEDIYENMADPEDESDMDGYGNETDVQPNGYGLAIPDEEMMKRLQSKLQVVTEYLTEEELDAVAELIERGSDPDVCSNSQGRSHRQKRGACSPQSCSIRCRRTTCNVIAAPGYRASCRCAYNWWGRAICSRIRCAPPPPPPPPPPSCPRSCSITCGRRTKRTCSTSGMNPKCRCNIFNRPRCTAELCP